MRWLAWLAGFILAILVVLFAVSNRAPITVALWPFAQGIAAPAYVVGLVPLAIGLILGAGLAGVGTLRARWRHRVERGRNRELERRLADAHAAAQSRAAKTALPPADSGP